ncbi:MAG TPA: hypothetical protein VLB11_07410 [Methyloceanibacter sp.]|nr:hypothetical protein [Methyloceanibacter sp.]
MRCQLRPKGSALQRTGAIFAATLFLGSGGIAAQEASIAIELNKLEPQGGQCRAYLVIENKSSSEYSELKLDLVLFRPDGVIGRRFAVELAPLRANKRTVKLFDLEGTACEEVGSLLINDVMECKTPGPVADCLQNITTSTLTNVQLNK